MFKTKVVTRGVDVTVNAFNKHSWIRQYLEDGRAPRPSSTMLRPGCERRLSNLEALQTKAHAANR